MRSRLAKIMTSKAHLMPDRGKLGEARLEAFSLYNEHAELGVQ